MATAQHSPPDELSILTLNVWGLLRISPLRPQRMTEIAKHINTLAPAIVCLQELFTQSDYHLIRQATADLLPYGKYYFSGAFGGGLAILSRYPIEESTLTPYTLNGRPTAFWRGDWFVGKGIARATIRIAGGPQGLVDVFNTHTHAPYESGPRDSYITHRLAQSWQAGKLIRDSMHKGRLVIAAGDWNMRPDTMPYRLLLDQTTSALQDSWRALHPQSALGPNHKTPPTARHNIVENGMTSNNVLNTWRWSKKAQKKLLKGDSQPVRPDEADPHGQRLDYVFVSTSVAGSEDWLITDTRVVMTERHPELHVSLSDHFGVLTSLTRSGADSSLPTRPASKRAQAKDKSSLDMYDRILERLQWYVTREHSQKFWRGTRFYGGLLIWVACLVAVWFVPHNYIAFVLMLVASLILTGSTIEGLLSLLFFSSELRSLKEFEWEIRNAKAVGSGNSQTTSYESSQE
ncbi:uncharacterized protein J7T54_006029 [Emericellopsis cladophorae]|uniref:Endonuclease/exonuclease/phosphatase domain-containing protein n=1 Tax=Emericellopsis cladophorae TaxID=2686198 RepID=A0A9P9Y9C3_9HYPO|nr:uncharacterized protein J7T54_006029 [Emericellopsis cladophorae]KAI6785695.1 hypothetical protein J7T54_006029 [Emericellopsis cladophorae]